MHERLAQQFHEELLPVEHAEANLINDAYDGFRVLGYDHQHALDYAVVETHDRLTNNEDYSSLYGYEAVRAAKRWCSYRGVYTEQVIASLTDGDGEVPPEYIDWIDYQIEIQRSFEDMVEAGDDVVIRTFEKLENIREWHERWGIEFEDPMGKETQIAMDVSRQVIETILRPLILATGHRLIHFGFKSPDDGTYTYLFSDQNIGNRSYALMQFEEYGSHHHVHAAPLVLRYGDEKEFTFMLNGEPSESDSLMLLTTVSDIYCRWQESQWNTL